ncbi:MAG TPA: hypothetical protein PLV89_01190 [Treponemataceae bacterium]|nr:hypothetical protein [Treponemataceae bacterium]
MDHDNKVKIQKPEVKLFLPENLYPITKSSPQIYDLEDEYAKTRKNKSFFIPLLMAGLCLFVGLLTFGVTKYIDYKNKQITVGIDVFDDLNLMKLLDMVSRTEDSLKAARSEKSRLEIYRDTALSDLEAKRDADIYALESMPIRASDKSARTETILSEFEANKNALVSEYSIQIAAVDQQIADISKQLESLDSTRVQQAQEQQAAIDSQRQMFELEKKQIIENYEKIIVDIQQKQSEQQKAIIASQLSNLDTLSGDFREFLLYLDPVIEDERGQSILDEAASYEQEEVFSAAVYQDASAGEDINELLSQVEDAYSSLDYITNIVLSVPQQNTIPLYVSAMKRIAYLIGLNLSNAAYHAMAELQNELAVQQADYEAVIAEGRTYIKELESTNTAQTKKITSLTKETEALKSELTAGSEKIAVLQEDLRIKEEQLNALKDAEDQIKVLKAEKKILEGRLSAAQSDRSVLQSAVKFFDEMSNQNGDAGYVLNTDNRSRILVYISPLFQSSAENAQAFIFRKADELIGTVSLVSSGGYIYAIPDSDDIAGKIRPNDRVLLNLVTQ